MAANTTIIRSVAPRNLITNQNSYNSKKTSKKSFYTVVAYVHTCGNINCCAKKWNASGLQVIPLWVMYSIDLFWNPWTSRDSPIKGVWKPDPRWSVMNIFPRFSGWCDHPGKLFLSIFAAMAPKAKQTTFSSHFYKQNFFKLKILNVMFIGHLKANLG